MNIKISKSTLDKLEEFRDNQKESYDVLINRLIELVEEENLELSDQTKNDIEESRKQYKEGKFYAADEVKSQLGVK